MKMKWNRLFTRIGVLVLLFGRLPVSYSAEKLMIKGYDPVAYFITGKAVKGLKDFEYQWSGFTFRFSSKSNLELFKNEPKKYAPQYHGYCAYAVSQGYTASVDPRAWDIVDDKLYLNYSKSVQKRWREKREEYITSADENWPELKKKESQQQ